MENPKNLLLDAIEAVQNAISIFSKAFDNSLRLKVRSNSYGLALAEFQYGYLLRTYAGDLLADAENEQLSERLANLQLSSKSQCDREALKHFEKAFTNFEQLNHLMGMYLSKKHLLALQPPNMKTATEIYVKEMR